MRLHKLLDINIIKLSIKELYNLMKNTHFILDTMFFEPPVSTLTFYDNSYEICLLANFNSDTDKTVDQNI